MTAMMGKRLAKAMSPKPSSNGLRPGTLEASPSPSAATSGTVIVDVVTPPGQAKSVVDRLLEETPEQLGDETIKEVITIDGIKFRFDDGWLMIRGSGTEPVIRLYSEASSLKRVDKLLEIGETQMRGLFE